MSDNKSNPFAALFGSVNQAEQVIQPSAAEVKKEENFKIKLESKELVDCLAREVFFITCQSTSKSPLVFLEDVSSTLGPEGKLDITLLGEALFERLLLNQPENHVKPKGIRVPSHVIEEKVITFLFESWRRLQSCNRNSYSSDMLQEVETLIMRNASTALIQPDLYPSQNLAEQTVQVLVDEDVDEMVVFMSILVKHLMSEEGVQVVDSTLRPVMMELARRASQASLLTLQHGLLRAALVLAKAGPSSAALLLQVSAPRDKNRGRTWAETLLGYLLSLSCLPGSGQDSDTIFSDVVAQPSVLPARQSSIHMTSSAVADGMHAVFEAILRSSAENRSACLDWLWGCLEANSKRGSLWSTYTSGFDREVSGMMVAPDGFILNLEAVALRLCAPFCCPPAMLDDSETKVHPKLLTVDPSFCAVETGPFVRGGLHKLTCLLPAPSDEATTQEPKRPHASNFTFVTESFFLAQRATDLGSRVVRERFTSVNQEAAQMDRLMRQIGASEAAATMREAMERTAGQLLAYRTALTEPTLVEMAARLHAATASWLVQLLLDNTPISDSRTSFAPGQMREVRFPLPGEEDGSTGPALVMRFVPEMLVENLASFLVMARRLHPDILEQPWLLWPSLTLIIALMGSPGRVRNPHLRAKLAEVLESLLPWQPGEEQRMMHHQQMSTNRFQRERLFKEHPHRLQVAESLVQVFVGIEMTGQSVVFEQKFNYRRPMYVVLDHLWSLPEHKNCFRRLANFAQENMEAVNPPIFLRFANLLINDAVYLLDEALGQMAALRQKQAERDSGAWDNLPAREREQMTSNLDQMGRIAKFHNILGRETIHMLEMLTSEIRSLFCHPTMVERISSMLNYFLLQLVGPKSKTLKVHNMKEFEFEPGPVVLDICRIYTHLGSSDHFCAAVSRDGRSYNAQLFPQAETVLARVGGAALLTELQNVAQRVAQHAKRQSSDDELLAGAPDDFLDPITFTIMLDPVILPSSQVSIDRATIARHLLSDQNDPFNRSPLTMDQVLPNEELRLKIEAWIAEQRASSSADS